MPKRNYDTDGFILAKNQTAGHEELVRELQKDLRELGYLKEGIDGKFGTGTETAVKGLQHDLLHNDGRSRQSDGNAPVRVVDFNRGRVVQVTGTVDSNLAGCVADMLDDADFPLLPKTDSPKEENDRIVTLMKDAIRGCAYPFSHGHTQAGEQLKALQCSRERRPGYLYCRGSGSKRIAEVHCHFQGLWGRSI